MKRIENDELLRKFVGNMFFKSRCPSVILGVKMPREFNLLVDRERELKG